MTYYVLMGMLSPTHSINDFRVQINSQLLNAVIIFNEDGGYEVIMYQCIRIT